MLEVLEWAEIRRMREVEKLTIREITRRTGRDRNTVRSALRSRQPPKYERKSQPSKLDPYREEIARLLRSEPKFTNTRIRELITELGYEGGKTILDECVCELRPVGLLRFCINYADSDDSAPPGILTTVRAKFGDLVESDLTRLVGDVYDFRNSYVAHVDEELTERAKAESGLKKWVEAVLRMYELVSAELAG